MDITYILVVLVVILLSMTLHEAMHAFTAYWLGDETAKLSGRLSLNPLKHIDPFTTVLLPLMLAALGLPPFGAAKPVPFNPSRVRFGDFGAALVGAAGPLTNFLLAFLGFVAFMIIGPDSATSNGFVGLFLSTFVTVNLAFFVFNMLPLPPLDGSRIVYSVAPDSVRRFMEMMERYGIVVIFGIVLLFNAQLGTFIRGAINAILTLFSLPFGG